MASLGSAANVYATCLRILRGKGYALARDVGDYEADDGPHGYRAQKDGFTFAGDNPIELLGLVAVYEHVQPSRDEPYWWVVDGPNIADELMERALERSLAELRERDPARWRHEITQALAKADAKASAAARLGISEGELQRILQELQLGS